MRALSAEAALAEAIRNHCLSQPGTSVEGIAAGLVGLHNTSQVSPYLSLRARLPGFSRSRLDGPMWGSWRMVRFRAMRLTMFVFPTDLLEIAAAATRHLGASLSARWLRDSGLSQADFDEISAGVDAALADGPLTARDLRRRLGLAQTIDLPGVVGRMCDAGRIVGGAPPRQWRSSIRCYHRWRDVLPEVDLDRWDPDVAVRELIHRYVRSYGPVTLDDVAWWTGLSKGRCRAALTDLAPHLEPVAVDGWVGPLHRGKGDTVAGDAGSDVRALPLLDPYVQGYRDRARFLEPRRSDFVYDGGGNAAATLVHQGKIIGVWQVTVRRNETVRYHLFAGVPPSLRRAAETDLASAGALYFDHAVDVVAVPTMEPLSAQGGRSAMHPLDGQLHRASRRSGRAAPP